MNVFPIKATVRATVNGREAYWEVEWSVRGGIPRIGESLWIHEGKDSYCYRVTDVAWSDTEAPMLSLEIDKVWGSIPQWMTEEVAGR